MGVRDVIVATMLAAPLVLHPAPDHTACLALLAMPLGTHHFQLTLPSRQDAVLAIQWLPFPRPVHVQYAGYHARLVCRP